MLLLERDDLSMRSNQFKSSNRYKLRASNTYLILMAKFSSDFGAFMNMVALSSYIYFLSESPFEVGAFLACRVFGGMIASLIANSLFRAFPGSKALACLDLVRAMCLMFIILLSSELHLLIIPFLGFVLGLCNSLFSIGLNSQLAHFVGKDHLGETNAWITTLSSIGMVIGALCSGIIISFLGYHAVFILNLFTYLFAALCIFLVMNKKDKKSITTETTSFKQDIFQLKSALKGSPVIFAMLVVTLADTLGSASHNVGFPIISKVFSVDESAQVMGYIIAVWAAGKLSGAFITKQLKLVQQSSTIKPNKARMEQGFFFAVLLMSFGFIFAFNQSNIVFGLIAFFIAGMGDGVSEVCFITRAQLTEDKIRLPLFSSISFMQNTGFGLGMLVSAMAFEYLNPGIVVGLFHGLPICVVLYTYIFSKRSQNKANHLDTKEKAH